MGILNSKFDAYVVRAGVMKPPIKERQQRAELDVNYYGTQLVGTIRTKIQEHKEQRREAPLGVLLDSCLHHCEWWGQIKYKENGLTNAEEFAQWYSSTRIWWNNKRRGPAPRLVRIQDQPFPCKDCCMTHWNESVDQWYRLN